LNWKQLIRERDEWVAHNFPDNHYPPPEESLIGCIEEVGELAHAQLKEVQNIRGTKEEHIANGKDAIGDLIVYLLGVMSHIGSPNIDPVLAPPRDLSHAIRKLSLAVGRLSDHPSRERIGLVIYYAKAYCKLRGWDFTALVHDTWREVKQRDWVKFPEDGLTA
jgi:NTP pyrophosphatase (non-canonical NTP hydrolase)